MAAFTLAPNLVVLRAELNALFPNRDKSSDGWIGDTAHSARVSDHNPDGRGIVHAVDLDKDLRENGFSMGMIADHLVARCRSGKENRLKYIIYNQRIASASRGWKWVAYNGINAHKEHLHASGKSGGKYENDTRSYGLEELMAMTESDWARMEKLVEEKVAKYAGDVSPRWTDEGTMVDQKKDSNPKQTLANAVFYVGATVRRVENIVTRLEVAIKALAAAKK